MEKSRWENLWFSFKKMLKLSFRAETSDFQPPPKFSSLPISYFCPQSQCLFSSPRRYLKACPGGTGWSWMLGLVSPSLLPAQGAEPMLPAGLLDPSQFCTLTKSPVSLLCYLGRPPTCPTGVGTPGLGRAGCGGDQLVQPSLSLVQETDKVTSPALRLHPASSSICHGPCTTWHFKFPSSHSVEKLQPASFLERRKSRKGETRGDPAPLQFLFTLLPCAASPLQHGLSAVLLPPEPSSTQQSCVGLIKTALNLL